MTSSLKKIISEFLIEVSAGCELRICGSQVQCLRPLSFGDIQSIGPI